MLIFQGQLKAYLNYLGKFQITVITATWMQEIKSYNTDKGPVGGTHASGNEDDTEVE